MWLGWNNEIARADTMGAPAAYIIQLPETLPAEWELGPGTSLDFALTPTNGKPGPRKAPDEAEGGEGAEPNASGGVSEEEDDEDEDADDGDEDDTPIDVSVIVTDAGGTVASVPLSRYGVIRRPLEMRVLRRRDLEEDRFANLFELVLQSYSIPLADFVEASPGLHIEELRSVGRVFDRSPAGEVIVDDLGFTRMDPAYTAVRVPSG